MTPPKLSSRRLALFSGLAFLAVVGGASVCDAESGAVVGFVTEQHLTRVVVEQNVGPSAPVESVMGRDVCICAPDDDVSEAERAIAAHPGRCAVCVGPTREPIGVYDRFPHLPDFTVKLLKPSGRFGVNDLVHLFARHSGQWFIGVYIGGARKR